MIAPKMSYPSEQKSEDKTSDSAPVAKFFRGGRCQGAEVGVRSRLHRAAALLLSIAITVPPAAPAHADALDDALALVGLTREEIGFQERGYWSRYPGNISYRMRHFDALLGEPIAVVTFARTAANALEMHLAPEHLSTIGEMGATPVYSALHGLALERLYGGFRAYSANLIAPESPDLVDALLAINEAGGRLSSFSSFGNAPPYPDYRAQLDAAVADVPRSVRVPLARLVIDLIEARKWVELGFRRVDAEDRLRVQQRFDLTVELTDALEYMPQIDDVMFALDEASLWYGGLKTVAALDRARIELSEARDLTDFELDWHTPLGWVRFRGTGDDEVDVDDTFLVVDLGGNDRFLGSAAASGPGRPVSALLDLGGNDRYTADERPAQGAGMAGVGVLIDAGGDDRYEATHCAQGYAQIGMGVLADLGGDDEYTARFAAQGSAVFGVGLLIDVAGDDRYRIESDGQGFGGPGGVGTLADRAGDDSYEAVRDPAITGRPSYHSEMRVAVSNAQGVGMGRRGDGVDGHSWAGGLGQLIDLDGNDHYTAGNWAMGTGYWFGTGILYDRAGDDRYEASAWTQGSGAHFCIGALIDEAGDDHHIAHDGGRSSLAFGHDFTVALLIDNGGDDVYQSDGPGLGHAINRSIAIAIDVGGDDSYTLGAGATPGSARYEDRFADYSGVSTYFADADSLGLFLDVGGTDSYSTAQGGDDSHWLDPEDSPNREVRNWSIGVDRAQGEVSLRPRTGSQ
jgi:hypothetical protein